MAFLISAQNAAGTGLGGTGAVAAYQSTLAYVILETSGNSASAALLASPDGATRWLQITAWAQGGNTTATAQFTGFYPHVQGQVTWASGGANTGTVTMQWIGSKVFFQ